MKKRIWELDAFRGLCILGMVLVHLVYDLTSLYQIVDWQVPDWFLFVQAWGSILFFLLSGICVTLGRRHVLRGLVVFGGGMICTLVTFVMVKPGLFNPYMMIYFGVLHCLGSCMLLWSLFKKSPSWLLIPIAMVLIAVGLYWDSSVTCVALKDATFIDFLWNPLGNRSIASSDYFPLLPNLGYFLAGAALGRVLYAKKESLLPNVNLRNPIIAALLFCGKHSLLIFLLHQPVLSGICMLIGG